MIPMMKEPMMAKQSDIEKLLQPSILVRAMTSTEAPAQSAPSKSVNKKWYSMKNLSGGTAEVMIYDEIGGWGITAKEFAEDLKNLGNVSNLHVRINSPGGSIMDGNAIYTTLRNHSANVHVSIDSVALSMGSVIAMAGDHIEMAENALMMIHNPWGVAVGEAEEMRKTADVVDKMKETLIGAYVRKTGMGRDKISDMMDDETWFSADEAKELGFVDEVTGEIELAASFDLSAFRNVPGHLKTSGPTDTTKEGDDMPKEDKVTDDKTVDTKAIADKAAKDALAAEKARCDGIRAAFKAHGEDYRDLMDACLEDDTIDVAAAKDKLLAKLGADSDPLNKGSARIELVEDASDKFRAGAAAALEMRAGVPGAEQDMRNEFRGYTLLDLAKHSLDMHGISTAGKSKMDIVGAAFTHSTSDFPYLLENVLGKELQRAYGAFEETWRSIVTVSSVPDFKQNKRIRLGSFNSLDEIKEGDEYTAGTIGEEYETIQAVTKGKMISLTRQAIINDDLNGFMRIAGMMGRAAARTVGNDVYSVINTNAAMTDGTEIFHADHSNLAGTGAAPTASTVGAARTAMRLQQDPNSNDYLDIRPAIFLGPVALEDTMRVLMGSETDPAGSNSKKPNPVRNMAQIITDPRLDATSATAWYLLADPDYVPLLEVAFLDGNQTPYLESEQGFTVDGTRWKVRMDYGVSATDHRGGYKNAGA